MTANLGLGVAAGILTWPLMFTGTGAGIMLQETDTWSATPFAVYAPKPVVSGSLDVIPWIELDRSRKQSSDLAGASVLGSGLVQETTSELVQRLRAETNLTWDQVSRLFGVSRRSVHLWSAGQRMAARHEERLSALLSQLQIYEGLSPEETRLALLNSRSGASHFKVLLDQIKRSDQVIFRAHSVRDMLQA